VSGTDTDTSCPYCHGTGKLQADGASDPITCPMCNGTGEQR
jgi:DnaJ-class molecular chaperone